MPEEQAVLQWSQPLDALESRKAHSAHIPSGYYPLMRNAACPQRRNVLLTQGVLHALMQAQQSNPPAMEKPPCTDSAQCHVLKAAKNTGTKHVGATVSHAESLLKAQQSTRQRLAMQGGIPPNLCCVGCCSRPRMFILLARCCCCYIAELAGSSACMVMAPQNSPQETQ